MILVDLRSFLLGNASITGLGVAVVDINKARQSAEPPMIILQRVGTEHSHHLKGRDTLHDARVQIKCVGNSARTAFLVSRAVTDLLDGATNFDWPNTSVQLAQLVSQVDGVDDETGRDATIVDFRLHHREK